MSSLCTGLIMMVWHHANLHPHYNPLYINHSLTCSGRVGTTTGQQGLACVQNWQQTFHLLWPSVRPRYRGGWKQENVETASYSVIKRGALRCHSEEVPVYKHANSWEWLKSNQGLIKLENICFSLPWQFQVENWRWAVKWSPTVEVSTL